MINPVTKAAALAAIIMFSSASLANAIDMKKGTDAFVSLSDCLDTVPDSDLNNPALVATKNKVLTSAVYSYIYHGLGKTETISEEDQSLNELATKYCSAHIKSVRAIISASKK